tara:strand:- start:2804 stop:3451 length:648 start_codon:yes stop_codon:yes gene_type:complete
MGGLRAVGQHLGITPRQEAAQRVDAYKDTYGDSAPAGGFNIQPKHQAPPRVDNVGKAYEWLTGDGIRKYTDGQISAMTPEAASGLIGNWQTETGDPTLQNLDIVEEKAKAGRGISQYTGDRRIAYDAARQAAIDAGVDPNSMDFQLEYFADEYLGKKDLKPGYSLVGYTNSLDELGGLDAAGAARHLRRDFFRPSEPHEDRRVKNAQNVFNKYAR